MPIRESSGSKGWRLDAHALNVMTAKVCPVESLNSVIEDAAEGLGKGGLPCLQIVLDFERQVRYVGTAEIG